MKFSDLSYREYIALEIFSRLSTRMPNADDGADRAFLAADAFLRKCGKENDKENDKVARAVQAREKAETQVSLLLNMNEAGQFSTRVALLQLWEMLDVKNQTEAVQTLHELRDGIKICLDAERERQKKLLPGAPASTYTAERIAKLERLLG